MRNAAVAAGGIVLLGVIAFLAWLPVDPFEEPAAPLDDLVPADVDSAWRFDGPALLGSPFAQAAWDAPLGREARSRWDLDARVVRPLRELEATFRSVSLGLADAPGVERDLMPAEVVVATRGDDLLLATRISSRARAFDLLRKLPEADARAIGLSIEGPFVVVRQGPAPLWVVRHRDVLFLSTAAAFARDAAGTAERGTGGLASRGDFAGALEIGRPAGARVLGWVLPAAVVRRTAPSDGEASPWWRDAVQRPDTLPLRVALDLGDADRLGMSCHVAWREAVPDVLAPLVGGPAISRELAARADALAVPGETIASGGLAVPARSALRALLGSQPPERQTAFEDALAAAGESLDSMSASMAAHVEDGVGFVVARLRESDQVLGGDDPGTVRAVPATVVSFRLRTAASGDALLAEFRRWSETLFGAPLGDRVEVERDGTRLHVLARKGLAGQWELLRPAFAFRGTEFLFATHEGFLRRALSGAASDADGASAPSDARTSIDARTFIDAHTSIDARTFAGRVRADPLRRWLADQAWEWADRATWRDWAAERLRIQASIPAGAQLRPEDRETYADARIREIKARRRREEIPAAADAYRERLAWLAPLGDVRIEADVTPGAAVLRAWMDLAPPR